MLDTRKPTPSAGNPFRLLRHIPGQPLTYIKNPKVACTSIELALWRAHDPVNVPERPHGRKDGPFISIRTFTKPAAEEILNSAIFSVVRNPYSRFLSAFLSKVALPRADYWVRIAPRLGYASDHRPTMVDLLSRLLTLDASEADPHFRPQHVNLMYGVAPLDFLGCFERFYEVADYMARFGIPIKRYQTNRTDASDKISIIDTKSTGLIREYYADDFRLYGYSEDISTLAPIRVLQANPDRSRLSALLGRLQTPHVGVANT